MPAFFPRAERTIEVLDGDLLQAPRLFSLTASKVPKGLQPPNGLSSVLILGNKKKSRGAILGLYGGWDSFAKPRFAKQSVTIKAVCDGPTSHRSSECPNRR